MENNTTPSAQPVTPSPVTPPAAEAPTNPPITPTPPPATPMQPTQTAPTHSGHHIPKIIALVLVAVNVLLALYIIVTLLSR